MHIEYTDVIVKTQNSELNAGLACTMQLMSCDQDVLEAFRFEF